MALHSNFLLEKYAIKIAVNAVASQLSIKVTTKVTAPLNTVGYLVEIDLEALLTEVVKVTLYSGVVLTVNRLNISDLMNLPIVAIESSSLALIRVDLWPFVPIT